MKTTRLMLTSVLALALLGSAACSTSEDSSGSAIGDPGAEQPGGQTDPGKGAEDPGANAGGGSGATNPGAGGGNTQPEPPAQGGDDVTIDKVIEGMAPTARINYQVVEDGCGDSQECLEGLAKLQGYFANCADCSPLLANFNNSVTNSQLSSGNLPTTLPQAKDVSSVLDEALNADGADTNAGDSGNAEPSLDTAVDTVVDELNKMGIEETDWTGIVNMVDEGARADFEETVKDALATSDDPTAKALLDGEPVAASDAAEAIENATK